jgi:hypothetical protein
MYGSNFTKGYQGRGFQPLSPTEAYVLGTNGNLWHEGGRGARCRRRVIRSTGTSRPSRR